MAKVAKIFIGIQASGKSTFFGKHFEDFVYINLDTLKKRSRERTLLGKCIENGDSFVVDNTNPTRLDRKRYFDALEGEGYVVHGYFFRSSLNDCLKRNAKRQGRARIPEYGVRATYEKLEPPSYDEGFDKLYYVALEDDGYTVRECSRSDDE